jgi:hypothetical protein
MSLADIIILGILLLIIILIIYSMKKSKKENKCLACPYSNNCSKKR